MPAASADYIVDTPYPSNFTKDQGPAFLNHVARLRGLATVALDRPFTYCELACGPGLTSNVLAASLPQGDFYAVDLNPDHITQGKALAAACQIGNVTFIESSFEGILSAQLPPFDFITIQGTYSWLSATARQQVRKVIDRLLKPEGLVHVHCAVLPGGLPYYPLKEIVRRHGAGSGRGSREQAAQGLSLLEELRDGKAAYFEANPSAREFVDMMRSRSMNDVAHEFFNEWAPQFFSDIAAEMSEIGLHFCGSTKFRMNFVDKGIPKRFRALIETFSNDSTALEDLKGLVVNERTRRDVFSRRAPRPGQDNLSRSFADAAFLSPHPELPDVAKLRPRFREVVRDLLPLAEDGTKSLSEIFACQSLEAYSEAQILDAVHELTAVSQLWPIPKKTPGDRRGLGERFRLSSKVNRVLLETQVLKEPVCTLASPLLGNGVGIGPISGLLLLSADVVGLEDAAEHAMALLDRSGKSWVRDNSRVSGKGERLAILRDELEGFRSKWIPALHRLGLIEPLPA